MSRCYRLRGDAVLDGEPPGALALTFGARRARLAAGQATVGQALLALRGRMVPEEELVEIVRAGCGLAGVAAWATLVASLDRANVLEIGVTETGGRRLATFAPRSWDEPAGVVPDEDDPVVLSRFAFLRRSGGRIVVESAENDALVSVDDPRVGLLVAELGEPTTMRKLAGENRSGLGAPGIRGVVRLLARARLADVGDVVPGGEASESPACAQWAFADRLFHRSSRAGAGVGAGVGYGGTYHQRDRRPPLPAASPVERPTIALPPADAADVATRDPSLDTVLRRRRSVREHDDCSPITVGQLGELLDRVQRMSDVRPDRGSGEVCRRPYPAGGSLYELEIYTVVDRCDGLDPGLYRYDSLDHRLEILGGSSPACERLLSAAQGAAAMARPPQVLLAVTARFGRVMWKYESMAYALVLKDLGVLYQTLYLVATAMGLAPCAIGGGERGVLEAAAGLDPAEEAMIGEFAVGAAPRT